MSATSFTGAGPLVTASELAARLGEENLIVLDASWTYDGGPTPKVEGTIPGALKFDLDALSDPESDLPHMLPAPARFKAGLRALGVNDGDALVVYDRIGLFSAPRAWWMLKVMGADARVLDGGLPAWIAAGGQPSSALPSDKAERPGNFSARFDAARVADIDDVAAAIGAPSVQVVDARSPERFAGLAPEPRPGLRAGHVPGSLNAPWSSLLDAAGRMRPEDELRTLFANAGVNLDRPVIASCGSGVTACVVALALEVLGVRDWSVYDGSWAEWGGDPARPIETAQTSPAS